MKTDVMQWVNSCSQCSRKKRRKPETEAGRSESLISPQIHEDVDRCVTVCMDTSGRLELFFILYFSFCLHAAGGMTMIAVMKTRMAVGMLVKAL